MKNFWIMAIAIVLNLSLLSGCSWDRQDTGTLAGGVVGAAAGNVLTGGSVAGTAVGAVGGAIVGNQLSR